MCTLTLAYKVLSDAPIAVAANRDESIDRPSEPPDVYTEDPLVIAPRDCTAGGTWIGVNEFGCVAGISNRPTGTDLDPTRSRGLLVADVLEAHSMDEATAIVERAVDDHAYDGFNLVVADERAACCFVWDGQLTRYEFDPGIHVVVNVAVDERVAPSADPETVRVQLATVNAVSDTLTVMEGESAMAWLDRASAVLADHEYGVCVHEDGYGTRSSSLLSIGNRETEQTEGERAIPLEERLTYEFADGPPCQTSFESVDLDSRPS